MLIVYKCVFWYTYVIKVNIICITSDISLVITKFNVN